MTIGNLELKSIFNCLCYKFIHHFNQSISQSELTDVDTWHQKEPIIIPAALPAVTQRKQQTSYNLY